MYADNTLQALSMCSTSKGMPALTTSWAHYIICTVYLFGVALRESSSNALKENLQLIVSAESSMFPGSQRSGSPCCFTHFSGEAQLEEGLVRES